MGEDLWFLASDVMGYCPQVLCIQRVGSNVVNLLTNQIWAEHRRPRKEGFKVACSALLIFLVFFPSMILSEGIWSVDPNWELPQWYGMVWYGMAFPEQLPSQLRLTCPMLSTNDGRQVHLGKKRPTHTMVLLVNKCMMLWWLHYSIMGQHHYNILAWVNTMCVIYVCLPPNKVNMFCMFTDVYKVLVNLEALRKLHNYVQEILQILKEKCFFFEGKQTSFK